MGWEIRSGRAYYYKPARVGGRPRRIYLGSGSVGKLHAALDRRQRRTKEALWASLRAAKAEAAEADRLWADLWAWARALAAASLASAGWYRHRGQWRRAKGRPRTRQLRAAAFLPAAAGDRQARLKALAARADAGDDRARVRLRGLLGRQDVWHAVGRLTAQALTLWVGRVAHAGGQTLDSVLRGVEEKRGRMSGPDPTPAERAVADVAGVAVLALDHADRQAAAPSLHRQVLALHVRRQKAAAYRLCAVLKTLVRLRAAAQKGGPPTAPSMAEIPGLPPPFEGGRREAG